MTPAKFILASCSFSFFACQESTSSKTVSADSSLADLALADTSLVKPRPDSVTTFYWEKLPIHTVAQLILKDSIRPVTRPLIYQMLDSLTSDLKQTRQYYFNVFNKIMNKADGELAESIGGYALTYVQTHPKEFVENSRSFSRNQLETWASNIGIEIFLSSNDHVKDAFDQVGIVISDNCKDCNTAHKSKLKEFNNLIWRTIQENQQSEKGPN